MKLHQYQPNEHGVCIYREDDFICCGLSNSERHQLPEPTPPTPPINAPIHSAWCTCNLCQEWVAKHLAHAVEPTPPTETQPQKFAMALELLESTLPFTQCDSGCGCEGDRVFQETVAFLKAHKVAAPAERVDDVIARMIEEVAPAPLCVSTETVKQLRPLLEELAQRRASSAGETRNSEDLNDFTRYCREHVYERFWQALRNWSKFHFIYGSDTPLHELPDATKLHDTFNLEGLAGTRKAGKP